MRLSIRHTTRYEYDPPAKWAGLRLKLFPSKFDTQRPGPWSVTVNGAAAAPMFTGPYGDAESLWTIVEPTSVIEIVAEGVVEVSDSAGVVRGLAEAARPGVFLRTSELTAPSAEIEALAQSVKGADVLEQMHALCGAVLDAVEYQQSSTSAHTTAAQALKLGRGVCQDHAHIFVTAARLRGVPARYVAGYLMADGSEQTHAWAETFAPDLGWVGFDPANRRCPTELYVRLCAGIDAADAAPLRGSVQAMRQERLAVAVDIADVAQQ
jgi:transglutaminase-like putative cysteine protease